MGACEAQALAQGNAGAVFATTAYPTCCKERFPMKSSQFPPTFPIPARPRAHSPLAVPAALLLMTTLLLSLGGCASTDGVQEDLASARAAVQVAQSDTQVARSAALELERSQQLLAQAEASWQRGRDVDRTRHLSYLAQRRAETAMAMGERAHHEESMQSAGTERDSIRLQARTREAEEATRRAQAAGSSAQRARTEAESARERAAELERDLQALQGQNTARGMVVTLGDVLFSTGSATLFPGAQRSVQRLAEVLRRHTDRSVLIEGFTDSQGSESSNLALSQRRAEAVRRALVNQGIDADRVQVRGHGEAYPVADNGTAAGRQQNRRVEIVFSNQQGGFAPR